MLRKSKINPTISAFEQMYGKHNFDAHPWVMLGCAVELHVMPEIRKTWEAHTKPGFYLGTSWDHYRCYEVWVRENKSARIGQTVFFTHKYLTQPRMTETDTLLRASNELCAALQNAAPESKAMKTAVNAPVEMFSGKAKTESTPTDGGATFVLRRKNAGRKAKRLRRQLKGCLTERMRRNRRQMCRRKRSRRRPRNLTTMVLGCLAWR